MKIAETVRVRGNLLEVSQTHDFNPTLERVKAVKEMGTYRQPEMGDAVLVGVIPAALWAQWGKDAGVRLDDAPAMREVIRRKLDDPDNAYFRAWEGKQ